MPKIINDLQRARKVYGSIYRTPVRVSLQTESDAAVLKLDWKESVRVASEDSTNYALPPVSVTGPIDGITLVNGNRILLRQQTNDVENGIYVVNVAGGTWDRADDAIPADTLTCGATVYVEDGTTQQYTKWILQTKNVTLGGNQNWVPFGVATPAAPGNSIQYNNGGAFGGSANFTYNGSTVYLTGSLSQGQLTIASGQYSHAEGDDTNATGNYSHSEGISTTASALGAHSEGINTIASALGAHSEGVTTTASGLYSHAEGFVALATGTSSHAEGRETTAVGNSSHAEGYKTISRGDFSHAEGGRSDKDTEAIGDYSHAEGAGTLAMGNYSHSEGYNTEASGSYSHAEGQGTIASGSYQHVGGKFNKRGNDFSLFVIGNGETDADIDRSDVLRVNSGSIGNGRVEVTGSLAASMGLSGSLTQLVDGTSYLIAGANVTITSASNGAVTVSAFNDTFTAFFQDADLSSGIYTVNHNLNFQYATVIVYDDTDKQIIPDEVTAFSANTAYIDLTTFAPLNNTWKTTIIGGYNRTYTTTFNYGSLSGGVLAVTHNLNSQYVTVTVYDDNDNQIIPDDVTAVSSTSLDIDLNSYGVISSTWKVTVKA